MTSTAAPLLPYLERLLDGETVEWKTLGEVCEKVCSGGTPLTSHSKYYEGNIPWLRTQDIDWQEVHDTEIKITEEAIANSSAKLIPKNCVIVAMYGATAAKACINKIPLTTNQACCNLQIDEKQAHYKYAYYWICNEYERLRAQGEGSQTNLNAKKIKSYPIPVPPLRVQARIVEILDKFTQLEAELEAELEARNKQYDFYRNRLLDFAHRDDFDGKVEWTTLGKVCLQLRTGLNPRNNFKLNTDDASNYYVTVRELGGTELIYSEKTDLINDHALQLINNRSKLKVNDILFSGTGTIGKTAFIAEEPSNWNIKEGVYALTLDTRYVLPMFVLRYLQSQRAIDWIERMAAGSTVRSITMRNLEQLPFPLPPLSEQRRIVEILDRFDTLTNSISEGLPREIALRRKQYEYYRDALLRFPPPAPTA